MCQHLDHKVKITHVKLNKWSSDCAESLQMLCADTSKGNRTTPKPQHCKMTSQFSSEEE
jgi:hypothetical protein